jgi:hypothetical protein
MSAATLESMEKLLGEMRDELVKLTAIVVGAAPAEPAKLGMKVAEAMVLTRNESATAFYRWAKVNKVKPYARGKYRVRDLENAMAKKSWSGGLKSEGKR